MWVWVHYKRKLNFKLAPRKVNSNLEKNDIIDKCSMKFGSRLFQLQVQISFIIFTLDPSYFSGRHLLTVHLLSRYTSGTNLCLLVLKVAHKKNKKPVTSLDELNELK